MENKLSSGNYIPFIFWKQSEKSWCSGTDTLLLNFFLMLKAINY